MSTSLLLFAGELEVEWRCSNHQKTKLFTPHEKRSPRAPLLTTTEKKFIDLIRRVRANEHDAVTELLRRYSPIVEREIRVGMFRSPIRRVVDSVDISQSVWFSFFIRTAAGEYDLANSAQLTALLIAISRNKLASQIRRHNRAKRDLTRAQSVEMMDEFPATDLEPVEVAAFTEMIHKVNSKLSGTERSISNLRIDGLTWDDVAEQLGGTAQGRRMQMSRAVDRIATELGLDNE